MLTRFLAIPAGQQTDGWIEIRRRHGGPGGHMRQEFVPITDRDAAARRILRLGRIADVFIGAAPRSRPEGGRAAIEQVWCLWADCDDPAAVHALEQFTPAPTAIVRSGTGTNSHAWWALDAPITPDHAEHINRRLAAHLGADPAATDAARILRVPATLNHKTTPGRPVRLADMTGRRHNLDAITNQLPEVFLPTRAPAPIPPRQNRGEDPLLAIPPVEFVAHLTGQTVPASRKVSCPGHTDRTPSLHVFDRPADGWVCFGCGRGGSIFDLASLVWDIPTRGRDFIRLRRRLEAEFGIQQPDE